MDLVGCGERRLCESDKNEIELCSTSGHLQEKGQTMTYTITVVVFDGTDFAKLKECWRKSFKPHEMDKADAYARRMVSTLAARPMALVCKDVPGRDLEVLDEHNSAARKRWLITEHKWAA